MAIAGLCNKAGAKGAAVAHAAYVAREGQYARYLERGEVLEARAHGNLPAFANDDPSAFWAASDTHERANGTAYRELQIALPRELNSEQRLSLVKDFVAQEIGDTHAYQFAIHVPKAADGLENPHVHLMFSERRNDGIERGSDQYFKRYNPKFPERGGARKYFGTNPHERSRKSDRAEELKALRDRWEGSCNKALEHAGADVRISMKSYAERGLDVEPEPKQLPSEWRDGGKEAMLALREAKAAMLEVRREPSVIIDRVSARKSLFTSHDLDRELHKVVDDAALFNEIKVKIDADPSLVKVTLPEPDEKRRTKHFLTTKAVLNTEKSIQALGDVLMEKSDFGLSASVVGTALGSLPFELSDEQVSAVKHVTDDRRLGLVSGVAGAGKSTMLSVVRDAYEQSGYRVSGMALAGKAADELSKSSGIDSRTMASWLYRYDQGEISLGQKDVLVMDEAGMVHNGSMERVLDAANQAGAKVILVGDAEQLQPIERGTPFRSLSDEHGAVEISEVRRQADAWQRKATQDLSNQRGVHALSAYREAGCVHEGSQENLVPALVKQSLDGGKAGAPDSSIILSHRNKDVAMLNDAVRDERKRRGELVDARVVGNAENRIELAVGDRVVFTKNDRQLGVLNGQFGEVVGMDGDRVSVKRDGATEVSFSATDYADVKHGYASTIHKSQGMTVDRALVWGSPGLDRHLGYVAMSRHRDRLDVYQSSEATKERTLEACLSRSNATLGSVSSMIEEHGLGLHEDDAGRLKLTEQYPSAIEVERSKVVLDAVQDDVRAWVTEQQQRLEQAATQSQAALAKHQENEPPGERRRTVMFDKDAWRRREEWEGKRGSLEFAVYRAQTSLDRWQAQVARPDFESGLVEQTLTQQVIETFSPERVAQRDAAEQQSLASCFPVAVKKAADKALQAATEKVAAKIEEQTAALDRHVGMAVNSLAVHSNHEPTDSKLSVFLYQGPAQRREQWDQELAKREADVAEAEAERDAWQARLSDGKHEQAMVVEQFKAQAKEVHPVCRDVIEKDEKRIAHARDMRVYRRCEKALDANLGRRAAKGQRQVQAELVERYAKDKHPERLPSGLRKQVEKQQMQHEAQRVAQQLSRSRGGHGMGR